MAVLLPAAIRPSEIGSVNGLGIVGSKSYVRLTMVTLMAGREKREPVRSFTALDD